ncbi:L-tyrosine/L-aspartate decarboxylase [Frankliniella fusca]|uniref:L-tyrosine/L-aspartate decarboxylase n=1 Tax=Frankliniella fusca TaxID=407009 RepID=A0AAE1L6X7_9NEOP|nr:L-tyrosine/L-aspartate decarboxylase [Frankliniella fusca]
MDILQLEICEFAVLSGDAEKGWQMAVVTVQYNESFWREKRERLIQKHRHLLVPEHFLGRAVKNLPPRELVYSKFHEDYTDPHFLQGGFQLNVYWQLRLEDPDTFFNF